MPGKKERGLWELYENDPERADADLWDRTPGGMSRRGFLEKSGWALALAVGAHIPFLRLMPSGWIPAALAQTREEFVLPGKDGLRVLNDRPINAETPPHLLNDAITPTARHFIRNNGLVPPHAHARDAAGWTLRVDGEVHRPLNLSLEQLQRFPQVTRRLQIECGGNGRAGYRPPAKGNPWTFGAIGCAQYTGVRLRDVLQEAGLKPSAVYTGYYGNDRHLSGDPDKIPISRGTPIAKALDEHTLLVWDMNGEPLPAVHGFPLRVVSPGWPGSTSIKWLRRIWIRDRVHDGPKMTGYSYRVPRYPVPPGASVPEADMKIIESMPVKSLITAPRTGARTRLGRAFSVAGQAWAGDRFVTAVHVSIDFGATWIPARLHPPPNPYAWQRWQAGLRFPTRGYYEVWARATDSAGAMQPMVVPGWNPKGYLNNAMHRIAVTVT